jgi:catechol 2,3-dioxygenase-like lactoylglutathione lyase family enzyme
VPLRIGACHHGRVTATLRWNAVCVDCRDAATLARFYCDLLGWTVVTQDGDDWFIVGSPESSVAINIQGESWYEPPTWPERPGAKDKMMHFEIEVDDVEAAVRHAVQAGATVADPQPEGRDPSELRVMLDPAGHPFCLWT